jgi:hypothetical protein
VGWSPVPAHLCCRTGIECSHLVVEMPLADTAVVGSPATATKHVRAVIGELAESQATLGSWRTAAWARWTFAEGLVAEACSR